jgi:hypothetical protein
MPLRRETTRAKKRLNDRVIAELRELIRLGLPWHVDNWYHGDKGLKELRGLITGHFFLTTLCNEDGDEQLKKQLYEALREDLVPAHAYYRPGLRPGAWWEWDAPEPRRVIGRDVDEEGDNDQLPADEDPDLPKWAKGKLYFGLPAVYDGHLYEDEYTYLARLNLLFPDEIVIFNKYDSVINVNIPPGDAGKCAPCWKRAREIAKKIDFDLESAIQRYEFWIPGELYLKCEHWLYGDNYGIFNDADDD